MKIEVNVKRERGMVLVTVTRRIPGKRTEHNETLRMSEEDYKLFRKVVSETE